MKRIILIFHFVTLTVLTVSAQSEYVSRIVEYVPAPGQFVNTTAWGIPTKANSLIGGLNGGISLGGFGGYIVVGFDHRIMNDPNNPYGIDFTVFGNPLATGTFVTWAEPGAVMVMKDANGNGLADDTWYELAGSDYYFKSSKHQYEITYRNPQQPVAANVPWTDNQGNSGNVLANSFHGQAYYPNTTFFPSVNSEKYSFSGTLIQGYVDRSDPAYIQSYQRGFGYADNALGGSGANTVPDNPYTTATEGAGGDAFDIDWAVDADGNHVTLDGIDFIKVYTTMNADAGWLGEVSTEVRGVVDVAPNSSIRGVLDQVVLADLPLKVDVGYENDLEAYAFRGGILQAGSVMVFSVDDSSKAIIQNGKLKTIAPGKIIITAVLQSNPQIWDKISLEVISPSKINVIIDATALRINGNLKISATVKDKQGAEILGVPVSWHSSDNAIISIDAREENLVITGRGVGTAWLRVSPANIPSLKDSIKITVLPEASFRHVYLTIKDNENIVIARKKVTVENFDLNKYVDNRKQNYGIDQITRVTAAHAIAQLFINEEFASDLRFRDDAYGASQLYLWRVPRQEGNSVTYTYGYGGSTDINYDNAWIVKVNQYNYVNNLQSVIVNEEDEIVVYRVTAVATPWILKRLTTSSDTVNVKEPLIITATQFQQSLSSDRTVVTNGSDALGNQAVKVNETPYTKEGIAVVTDELGKATLTFDQGGSRVVSVAGELVTIFVHDEVITGIDEITHNEISVWPNPVTDFLYVQGVDQQQIWSYEIYTGTGEKIHSGSNTTDNQIDFQFFSSGIYIIRIFQENQVEMIKVIKP